MFNLKSKQKTARDRQEEKRRQEAQAAPYWDPEDMLRQEAVHVLRDLRWTALDPDFKPKPDAGPDPDPDRYLHSLSELVQGFTKANSATALCLSGGGIRSATFSLGVLQWLAGKGQLEDFHYISTVSGGGYMGSWLVNGLWQAYLSGSCAKRKEYEAPRREVAAELNAIIEKPKQNDTDKARLAALQSELQRIDAAEDEAADTAGKAAVQLRLYHIGHSAGTEGASRMAGATRISGGATDPVAPLRAYSNYLSPRGGLSTDAFTLVAIFLRNLMLNWVVWLPFLAALVALPRLYLAVDIGGPALTPKSLAEWWPLWGVLVVIILGIAYIASDLPEPVRRPARQPQVPQKSMFSWACFLPITLAVTVLALLGSWTEPLHKQDWRWFAAGGAAAHFIGMLLGVLLRKHWRKLELRPASPWGVFFVVVVGAVGGLLALAVLSQLGQGAVAQELSATQRLLYASFAVPAMTGAFWLSMTLYAGLMGRVSSEEDREWWARATAAWLIFTLAWVVAFGLVVWAPMFILGYVADAGITAVKFGIGSGTLGVLTALSGYWSKHGDDIKTQAQRVMRLLRQRVLDVMAGLVLLAMLLTLSMCWHIALDRCYDWRWSRAVCTTDLHAQTEYLREQVRMQAATAGVAGSDIVHTQAPEPDPVSAELAELGSSAGAQVYAHVLLRSNLLALIGACGPLLLVSIGMAFFMGANQFSLHGMYGNRLVRAYLGSGRPVRHPHWFTRFDPDDNPPLADLGAPLRSPEGQPRLYPLVNIALNLVKPSDKRLDWQQRKAASFVATPLFCGSAHLGFRPTEFYSGGMSLGRAMTISGAAASPNMGYHSSTLVTAVMTLFNVRLGWWSPNPVQNFRWYKEQAGLGLDVMLAEAASATGDEDRFIYLSDGGHFDNMGIYEMVRRRCRRIVLVDASCDGAYEWGDLLDAVRKIRVDLGIPIRLPPELPSGGKTGPRSFTADILYSERDGSDAAEDGELIVLKPVLREDDPPELAAYARDSARPGKDGSDPNRFPHQSTIDQFFDERQFESYRLLGYVTAGAALGPQPAPAPPSPPPPPGGGASAPPAASAPASTPAPSPAAHTEAAS
ncbi:patatin-like phospholipase family protein [Variovorax sp. dw_308]|uniref:patatin-like phospholipase family protein n=1 Tax=Variovorax sp. dw_308 TaxID=2721546 RepID=UPI00210E5F4A|nr:patatin-like phospholipase family protein [Variovorax sp. dw_308]